MHDYILIDKRVRARAVEKILSYYFILKMIEKK